mgnify:FL=1
MKNKVLVRLIVPELDNSFDVFIPVNEIVWKIKKLLVKSVADLSGINLDINRKYTLINMSTGKIYTNNEIIINTEIRNVTELVLISNNKGG